MSSSRVSVYDRSGVVVDLEAKIDGNSLEISRDSSSTTYQNDADRQIIADVTSFLSLTQKVTDQNGHVSYKKVAEFKKLNDPSTPNITIPHIGTDQEFKVCFGKNDATVATITVKDSVISIEQEEVQKIDPTLLKMALAGLFPKQITTPTDTISGKPITTSLTDLHTHYTGMHTSDILMKGIQKKFELGEPVRYPVRFLLVSGIKLDDLSMYFSEDEFLKFKEDFEKNKNETDPKKWVTFDITKMYDPRYKTDQKNQENVAKLKSNLNIPAEKSVIFDIMEQYYEYRDVLVKDINLFAFFLEEIAKDYKNQGVEYAEISLSKSTDPEWVKIINDIAPEIEKKYGIKMRFLGIIARTADQSTRKEQIRALKETMEVCPYIVGADVLAAENNSTYDMMPELKEFLLWSEVNFPGLILRVHAGETSYHPENIAGAVELAQFAPWAKIRVGHGIHGVHSHVIEWMKEIAKNQNNLIAECNPCSNITLNMHVDVSSHTLQDYIKHDIPMVLGSDGHGLYQSRSLDLIKILFTIKDIDVEAYLKRLSDVEKSHISYIDAMCLERTIIVMKKFVDRLTPDEIKSLASENPDILDEAFLLKLKNSDINGIKAYIDSIKALDETHQKLPHPYTMFSAIIKSPLYQREWQNWKAECKRNKTDFEREMAQRRIQREAQEAAFESGLREQCSTRHIPLFYDHIFQDSPEIKPLFHDKTPIMINGIINQDDPNHDAIFKETVAMIRTLLETMDPSEFYFVTTATDIGVQNIVHTLVNEYNNEHPNRQFDLVGYLHKKTRLSEISDKLSAVVMVDDCNSIYQMHGYISKQIENHHLKFIAVGGDMWTRDVIQTTKNAIDIREDAAPESKAQPADQLFLLSTALGASQIKSHDFSGSYSYDNALDLTTHVVNVPGANVKETFNRNMQLPIDSELLRQGKVTASDTGELLSKIMQSPLLENYFSNKVDDEYAARDAVHRYFTYRIQRWPMDNNVSSAVIDNDPTVRIMLENIASSFQLPAEQPLFVTPRQTLPEEHIESIDTNRESKLISDKTATRINTMLRTASSKNRAELELLQAIQKYSVGKIEYKQLMETASSSRFKNTSSRKPLHGTLFSPSENQLTSLLHTVIKEREGSVAEDKLDADLKGSLSNKRGSK